MGDITDPARPMGPYTMVTVVFGNSTVVFGNSTVVFGNSAVVLGKWNGCIRKLGFRNSTVVFGN